MQNQSSFLNNFPFLLQSTTQQVHIYGLFVTELHTSQVDELLKDCHTLSSMRPDTEAIRNPKDTNGEIILVTK